MKHDDLSHMGAVEELIRKGKVREASRIIKSMPVHKIPRHRALNYSNLARRLGLHNRSLRVLFPFISGSFPLEGPPSNEEKLSYALTLSVMGLKNQAKAIFETLDFKHNPNQLINYAYHLMNMWDYKNAYISIQKFLSINSGELSYSVLVAQLNSIACLINLGLDEIAFEQIYRFQEIAANKRHFLILGNSYELLGQCYLKCGKFVEAKASLKKAETLLKPFGGRYLFYVEKWSILTDLYAKKRSSVPDKLLSTLRQNAMKSRDWETVRDCDFHQSILTYDLTLFNEVYYGTPYLAFRKRMRASDLGSRIILKGTKKTIGHRDPLLCLDLMRGEFDNHISLKAGGKIHHFLQSLFYDTYKPLSPGELFEWLFSDERFNPHSSPAKLHQIVLRTNNFFQTNNLDLKIEFRNGGYVFDPKRLLQVNLPLRIKTESKEEVLIRRLRKKLPTNDFKREFAEKLLNIKSSSANQLISYAITNSLVEEFGSGRGKYYRFKKVS